ncbi:hypothetical protein [Microbacterium sp. NPDC055683]
MRVVERVVDFERLRQLRCGACEHEWNPTAEWLELFSQALEACPSCGTDCQGEDRPRFHAEPNDPSRDGDAVRELYWYHSSTHANWPNRSFDPLADLTGETKRRMERMLPPRGLERWAEKQMSKALHVGTYEAAIENMFRRIHRQGSAFDQFFLYRVRLRRDCVIEPGVHVEPTDSDGDAQLSDVCGPGVNVFRYVNVHEDASSISLAIGVDAISAVQKIAVPLSVQGDAEWIMSATERLLEGASKRPAPPTGPLAKWMRPERQEQSLLPETARSVAAEVAADLPRPLRERFHFRIDEESFLNSPTTFPSMVLGLARLVTDSKAVLDHLSSQPWRAV